MQPIPLSDPHILPVSQMQDPAVKAAVIISGKPTDFIAGADIAMLDKCKVHIHIRAEDQQSIREDSNGGWLVGGQTDCRNL